MSQLEVNGCEIRKISKEEMALYIEKIFQNPKVRNIVAEAKDYNDARSLNDFIAEFCILYAKSTGDLSTEPIEKIAESVNANIEDYRKDLLNRSRGYSNPKNSTKQKFFCKSAGKFITSFWSKQMGLNGSLNIENAKNILSAVATSNRLNRFNSHSFSGALYDEVVTNGLDISKEKFTEEYSILSKLATSPFMTGKLCVCELSKASIGYTHSSPERMWMVINSSDIKRGEKESNKSFATRSLISKVENSNLSENEKQQCLTAGMKMIDYYFTNPESAIAIMDDELKTEPKVSDFTKNTISSYTSIVYSLPFKAKKEIVQSERGPIVLDEIKDIYKNITSSKVVDESMSNKTMDLLNELKSISPEVRESVDETLNIEYNYLLTQLAISNFETFNADGYIISSGKVSPDKMAIAKYDNLATLYGNMQDTNFNKNCSEM